jgi:hypothetical protein
VSLTFLEVKLVLEVLLALGVILERSNRAHVGGLSFWVGTEVMSRGVFYLGL